MSLLQLPHFTEYMISDAGARKFQAPDIASFSALPLEKRTEFYQKENFTPGQVKDIEAVLAFMPTKIGFDYTYEVEGEEIADRIVCKAIVTFAFTVTRNGAKPKPKPAEAGKTDMYGNKKPVSEDDKQQRIVHAPNFPDRRDECWWVVIGDTKGTGQLVGITKVGSIEDVSEGKVKFMAPATEGTYSFTGWLMCDGYVGLDRKFEFRIKVVKDVLAEKAIAAQQERAKNKQNAKQSAKVDGTEKEAGEEGDSEDDDDDDDDDEDDYDDSSPDEDDDKDGDAVPELE